MLQEFFEEIITQSDVGMENSDSEDEGIQSGEEEEEDDDEILKGIKKKGITRLEHKKQKKGQDTKEEQQYREQEEEEEDDEEEEVQEDDEEAIDEWEDHLAEIPKLKVRSSKSYFKLFIFFVAQICFFPHDFYPNLSSFSLCFQLPFYVSFWCCVIIYLNYQRCG